MGLCGSSAKVYDANEAIRLADNSHEAQELIASVNVAAKGKDGRIPFIQACKFGRVKMIRFMIENDKKNRLTRGLLDAGLIENCMFETDVEAVKVLVQDGGASVKATSSYGETPLTALARRTPATSKATLTQRREAAVFLIEEGADLSRANGEGLVPICVAAKCENEKMALLLAEKGANILDVQRFMNSAPENARNWVAGSVLSKYAFKYPKFVEGLKKQFMKMFDQNGDGRIDKDELKTFIATHVKMAFKAGLMPTAAFFDDGTLEIDQIEHLLETRCKDMLRGYFAMDTDGNDDYSWEELLPIVQDFYTNLWNQDRPADADMAEDVDYSLTKTDGGGEMPEGVQDYGPGTGSADPDEDPSASLPPNWVAVVDPASGATYYANTVTRETSWEVPTA